MVKRIKRIVKKIDGLKNQEKSHQYKIETEKGYKDTTNTYWEKEILQFQKQRKILEEKLKKLKKDK